MSHAWEPGGPVRETGAVLGQLGGVLLTAETIQSTVELVTRLAVETIAGTVGAGVTVVDERGHRTAAASNPLVTQADALQYAAGSGPCLTACRELVTVRVDDVTTEDQWPEWSSAVARLGIRSVLSVPLAAAGISVGAIKVYSDRPGVYDARAEQVLGLFAQQAAVLLTNMLTLSDARRLASQLTEALDARDLVSQAKGVLLARGAADDETAFALLVGAAQRAHVPLHEVARLLLAATTTGSSS